MVTLIICCKYTTRAGTRDLIRIWSIDIVPATHHVHRIALGFVGLTHDSEIVGGRLFARGTVHTCAFDRITIHKSFGAIRTTDVVATRALIVCRVPLRGNARIALGTAIGCCVVAPSGSTSKFTARVAIVGLYALRSYTKVAHSARVDDVSSATRVQGGAQRF